MLTKYNLIIFIDAFPYFSLKTMNFLSSIPYCAKVVPGFGYSVNVKAEIFGGYKPDDVGYLCEWMYDSNAPLRKYQPLFSKINALSKIYLLDRIIHKLISRIFNQNVYNIPFKKLGYFKKSGVPAYEDSFNLPTIFSQLNNLKKILYSKYRNQRDKNVFLETKKILKLHNYNNLFLALADLDYLMHKYGILSPQFEKKIMDLDNEIEYLWTLFLKKNPQANLFVISDHGMATVNKKICIDLESKFGPANENSYIFFIDATMVRIWVFNNNLRYEIESYLSQKETGKIIEENERKEFGITSREFGDIIYLLNEGSVFIPSFFGRRMPKAMHGYHPYLESQHGIFLSTKKVNKKIYTTCELHQQLIKMLFNDD